MKSYKKAMKATKRLLYAHWSIWMPLAKEVLDGWSLAAASHFPTRDCRLTAHLWARSLQPPQKVMRMLKSVKHLFSAYNHEGKITFQS